MKEIKSDKGIMSKISDSRRGFMKGLATVAAATPVVGALFNSKDADAALECELLIFFSILFFLSLKIFLRLFGKIVLSSMILFTKKF